MKKLILTLLSVLVLCGCSYNDDFSDDYTYTTIYPLEYATQQIYGELSEVHSIYPDGVNPADYNITEKLLNNFSKGNKFIYNGLSSEGLIARDLLNKNNNIEIVDGMKGMTFSNHIEELWLDPSNYLMVCRNIKTTLMDYEKNVYSKEKIEKNYELLKEDISILDVNIYSLSKDGDYKTILATNDVFSFLTKYGINVISLDSNNNSIDKSLSDARRLINSKQISYVYSLENDKISDSINTFINDNKLKKIEIDSFNTLTDEQRLNGDTYISLMNNIIDEYKKELFK